MTRNVGRRRAGNLPAELTSFIGRSRELRNARKVLGDARLLTLVGVGGVGKTRLAIRLGDELGRVFPGGVWMVDLSSAAPGTDLTAAAARTLGDVAPTVAAIAKVLDERSTLLIVDNCEHLLDECATFVTEVLRGTTQLRVLATSRQALGVLGENVLDIGPLDTPSRQPNGDLHASEAVRLFTERASSAIPSFALSTSTATAVAEVCRRLDGIPLAIELAAIRLHAWSLPDLLSRLDDEPQLLSMSSRAPHPRQRSLHALNSWSYELCADDERRLWARLSVFAERFDLAAAVAVCGGDGVDEKTVPELLASLMEKSIIHRADGGDEAAYQLMAGARQFGATFLREPDDLQAYRERHARHYARVACRLADEAQAGGIAAVIATGGRDHGNLAEAHDYLLAHGQHDRALRLAVLMCLFPPAPHAFADARKRLDAALSASTDPTSARARALWTQGTCALAADDEATSVSALREATHLAGRLGDETLTPYLVEASGLQAAAAGDLEAAFDLLTRAFRAHADRADEFGIQQSYRHLLTIAWQRGEPAMSEVRKLPREFGLTLRPQWTPFASFAAGLEQLRRFNGRDAATEFRTALAYPRRSGDHRWIALCFDALAQCAWLRQDHSTAARLHGSARVLRQTLQISGAFPGGGLDPRDECAAQLRSRMGAEQFTVAVNAGAELTVDEAASLALNHPAREPREDARTAELTRRELDVAGLVADGLTNEAIGAELAISKRTVESHIEHIMTKLGYTRRTQIATWVTTSLG